MYQQQPQAGEYKLWHASSAAAWTGTSAAGVASNSITLSIHMLSMEKLSTVASALTPLSNMAVLSTSRHTGKSVQAAHHILCCQLHACVKLVVRLQIIDLPGRGQRCQVTVIPTA
jgi:cytochrome c oxidase assembly factor CtaG